MKIRITGEVGRAKAVEVSADGTERELLHVARFSVDPDDIRLEMFLPEVDVLVDVGAKEVSAAEVARLKAQNKILADALRAALAVWCPNHPGGDGADGETYELATRALEGKGRRS